MLETETHLSENTCMEWSPLYLSVFLLLGQWQLASYPWCKWKILAHIKHHWPSQTENNQTVLTTFPTLNKLNVTFYSQMCCNVMVIITGNLKFEIWCGVCPMWSLSTTDGNCLHPCLKGCLWRRIFMVVKKSLPILTTSLLSHEYSHCRSDERLQQHIQVALTDLQMRRRNNC